MIEWTHWRREKATAQRGDDWCVFDAAIGLIREIRAYHGASAIRDVPIGERVEFDCRGRGCHLRWE